MGYLNANSLSNFDRRRHAPVIKTDQRTVDRLKGDILHNVRLDAVASLVTRIVQLDDGHNRKVLIADNEINVLPADLVELHLIAVVPGLSDPQQRRHGYLRQENFLGQRVFKPVKENLLRFTQRRLAEIRRYLPNVVLIERGSRQLLNRPRCVLVSHDLDENHDRANKAKDGDQAENNQVSHRFGPFNLNVHHNRAA